MSGRVGSRQIDVWEQVKDKRDKLLALQQRVEEELRPKTATLSELQVTSSICFTRPMWQPASFLKCSTSSASIQSDLLPAAWRNPVPLQGCSIHIIHQALSRRLEKAHHLAGGLSHSVLAGMQEQLDALRADLETSQRETKAGELADLRTAAGRASLDAEVKVCPMTHCRCRPSHDQLTTVACLIGNRHMLRL